MIFKQQIDLDQNSELVSQADSAPDSHFDAGFETQPADSRFQIWLVCLLAVVLLLTILVAPVAVSADSNLSSRGFYAGIDAGQSSFFTDTDVCSRLIEEITDEVLEDRPSDRDTLDDVIDGTQCSDDASDTYFSLFAGYQINPIIAVEGGLSKFGKATARFETQASNDRGSVSATGQGVADAEGVSLSALISTPVDRRFSVFGKIGVLAWSADLSLTATGTGTADGDADSASATLSRSDSGADLLYGAGARYRVNDNVGVRLTWTRYEVIELETLALGLEMRF